MIIPQTKTAHTNSTDSQKILIKTYSLVSSEMRSNGFDDMEGVNYDGQDL